MILEIDKRQVFASTAGKDFDPTKKTVFLLHGSGLSHIVWSLTEQFLSNKDLNILSWIYLGMEILMALALIQLKKLQIGLKA